MLKLIRKFLAHIDMRAAQAADYDRYLSAIGGAA